MKFTFKQQSNLSSKNSPSVTYLVLACWLSLFLDHVFLYLLINLLYSSVYRKEAEETQITGTTCELSVEAQSYFILGPNEGNICVFIP